MATLDHGTTTQPPKAVFEDLISKIWFGESPYSGFPAGLYAQDDQSWGGGAHKYLKESVLDVRPKIIVEIGVWKGGSTLSFAETLRDQQIEGCVIAIDTWLGAWDHWVTKKWFDDLRIVNGYPQIYKTFIQNVVASELQQYIVPVPLDSVNACELLKRRGIVPDIVHIDAGHDYRAVRTDIEAWWPILRPGGILIGDDYSPEGGWPGVRMAFDDFFKEIGLYPIENSPAKCRIRKPA